MLSDILGTLIAFISIILLLSIVVTAMVQVSQALLRLRSRNLMKGIAALIINARESDEEDTPPTRTERAQAKKEATRILNAPNISLMDRVQRPDDFWHYWLFGPKVSWVAPEELPKAIKHAGVDLGGSSSEDFAEEFRRSEGHFKKRFLRMARGWSIFWAIIVALIFQVSAPTLYNELSKDDERRDRIVADAEQLLGHQAESLQRLDYNLVAPEALDILATRHPELKPQIEEASGVGTTRGFILEELQLALEDVPQRDALVEEYDALIDEITERKFAETTEEVRFAMDRLSRYQIGVWSKGFDYYAVVSAERGIESIRWKIVLGVLMTAILLSFGGSFWFEQLRNVVALRDSLVKVGTGKDEKDKPAD